jgi:hypothetical protein
MGNGSGPSGLNSRIYNVGLSYQEARAYYRFNGNNPGTSFYGLTPEQYMFNIKRQLGNLGAGSGAGSRVRRFDNQFIKK